MTPHGQAAKDKHAGRREHARHHHCIAAPVFVAGAWALDDAGLAGAISVHLRNRVARYMATSTQPLTSLRAIRPG